MSGDGGGVVVGRVGGYKDRMRKCKEKTSGLAKDLRFNA